MYKVNNYQQLPVISIHCHGADLWFGCWRGDNVARNAVLKETVQWWNQLLPPTSATAVLCCPRAMRTAPIFFSEVALPRMLTQWLWITFFTRPLIHSDIAAWNVWTCCHRHKGAWWKTSILPERSREEPNRIHRKVDVSSKAGLALWWLSGSRH